MNREASWQRDKRPFQIRTQSQSIYKRQFTRVFFSALFHWMRTASVLRRFLFVFFVVVVVVVVVLLLFESGFRVSGGIVYVYRQQQHQPKKNSLFHVGRRACALCQINKIKTWSEPLTQIYQEIDYSLALFSFVCSATVYIIIMQISLFSLRVSLSASTKTNNTYAEEK